MSWPLAELYSYKAIQMFYFPHFDFISAMVGVTCILSAHYLGFVGIQYFTGPEQAASWLDVATMLGLRP
jgi:hypothetical protein